MGKNKVNLTRGITGNYETNLSAFIFKKGFLMLSEKKSSICFNRSLIDNLSQELHEIEKIISFYFGYLTV